MHGFLHRCFRMVTRRGCGDAGILMRQQLSLARWSPIDARPSGISSSFDRQKRLAHKFAAPECPNLLKLRMAIEQNFQPICFYVKNDYAMGHHVYDQHFYGILCSPVFEGKTYGQINAMVDRVLEPIGLKGRVKLHCQPPSRFEERRRSKEPPILNCVRLRKCDIACTGGGSWKSNRK